MSILKNNIIHDINHFFGIPLSHFKNIKKVSTQGNNRIYRFTVKKKNYIVKYYGSFSDSYERFNRELNFLKYCKQKNINIVPKLIFTNQKNNFSIMSYINGRKITSYKINKKNLNQSISFMNKLNKEKHPNSLYAKDFCSCIPEYLKEVQKRINILDTIDIKKKSPKQFGDIMDEIKIEFKKIVNFFNKTYTSKYKKEFILAKNDLCMSPSDFGLQNTLLIKNKLFFIDFEYAGLDDPAKCLLDFFLNPNHKNVKLSHLEYFLKKMKIYVKDRIFQEDRISLLYQILRIKWSCILLNIFQRDSLERKIFSNNSFDIEELKYSQLKKVKNYLNKKKLLKINI